MKGKKVSILGGLNNYEIVSFLKGFSIITIVLMHLIQFYLNTPSIISKAATVGGSGVHVFFLCSGFGLFLSYKRKQVKYFDFMSAKFFKIYIPYIIIVLLSACIPYMFTGNRIKALLSHIFLYKMFVPEYESSFGGQLWFISTLFQFYFLFIPICNIKKRISVKAFAICSLIISMCWWIITSITGLYDERIWGSFFLQYLWEFVLGMIIAEILYDGKNIEISHWVLLLLSLVGISIATVLALRGGFLKSFNDIFSCVGYLSLAMLIYSLSIKWLNKIVLFIAGFSYELYLVHVLVFTVLSNCFRGIIKNEIIFGIFSFVSAVIMAYVYNKIICIVKQKCINQKKTSI